MMRSITAGLLSLCLVQCSWGDVLFDLEDVNVIPGQQAVVGVFVSGTASEGLDAYDLPIDLGSDGRGLPGTTSFTGGPLADFAQEVGTFSNVVISSTTGTLPNPLTQNFDGIFSDNGPQITLTGTPIRLFNLLIDTTAGFTGTVPLNIDASSNPNQFNIVIDGAAFDTPGGALSVTGGSISAVPEPSAMLMLGLVFGGGLGIRYGKSYFFGKREEE